MKLVLKIVSYISLILMLASCILVFKGVIDTDTNKTYLLVLTVLWFITAPFWMGKEEEREEDFG